jgi:hypothetical protein
LVNAGAERVDGDGDGHVDDIELEMASMPRSAKARTRAEWMALEMR